MSLFGKNDRDKHESDPGGPRVTAAAGQTPRRGPAAPQAGGEMANIGKSITIKGDLSGDEDLVVEGTVEGKIDLPNNELTIGPNGRVRADVHGKSVVVVGHVAGNVSGTERVEIQGSGVVDGDVRSPKLLIQEGAVLNGSVDMGGRATGGGAASETYPKSAGGAGGAS